MAENTNAICFRPPDDIKRMLKRAVKATGKTQTKIIIETLRPGLVKEWAGKKDQPA